MKGESKIKTLFRGQRATLDKEHIAALENNRGAVWIHAASVGEFEQARPLIELIKERYADGPSFGLTDRSADRPATPVRIVVTFFSPSGYEARKNYDLADGVYYLPFATRRNAQKFLEALQPQMAIFVKYEFWPAYLKELKKRAIPTYSISAIFRPTQRFFKWYGGLSLSLLRCFTHIYVQDERSKDLLVAHGIKDCTVAGDTRFDRVKEIVDSQKSKLSLSQGGLSIIEEFAKSGDHVIVAGSTWPEDERLLKQYMDSYSLRGSQRTKLILVPHEIDEAHLHWIFNLFQGRFVRYSRATTTAIIHAEVLVIDTIGLLSSIYRFGQAAYIGGGFGVGIHNTIEAAVYGVPVIFGPNYHHFREAQGLIDAGGGRSVKNYNELAVAMNESLNNHAELGSKAEQYVLSELGATEKIYKEIFN